MKKLLLIDSNAIIHRAYHAIPKSFKTRSGEQTNAVYGFTTTLIKALEDIEPDYVIASFDLAKKTFRHEEYAQYKATRVKADQELYDQIPRVYELLETLNVPVYTKEGYEADDVIGTIVESCSVQRKANELEIYIVSGDKDIFQLIDGNVFVYNLKSGLSQTQIVDRAKIKEDWALDPEDFVDLKALAGDPSDNIPGVPGIGPKTAIMLLQSFGTLKGIYDEIDQRKKNTAYIESIAKEMAVKPRILNLLIEHKDQAFLSQRLATICRDVPLEFDLKKAIWGDYDKQKLRDFFKVMSFNSLLKRFGAEPAPEPKTRQAKEQQEKDNQLKLL